MLKMRYNIPNCPKPCDAFRKKSSTNSLTLLEISKRDIPTHANHSRLMTYRTQSYRFQPSIGGFKLSWRAQLLKSGRNWSTNPLSLMESSVHFGSSEVVRSPHPCPPWWNPLTGFPLALPRNNVGSSPERRNGNLQTTERETKAIIESSSRANEAL